MNAPVPSDPPRVRLDPAALERLRELDPDGRHGVLQRVLTAYETSLTRLLAQLEAERDGSNAAAVRVVAHTLKSASASIGALELAAACAAVEARLRPGGAGATPAPGGLSSDVDHLLAQGRGALQAVAAMLRP